MFEGFEQGDVETSDAVIHYRKGGSGPPLLLLHGYPQTHVMWHRVAPELARDFTIIVSDLRGYGDSSKPKSDENHFVYSKRAMAADQVEVMASLGFDTFFVAGHDRGGRVAHRLALDHRDCVQKLAVLDIVPTHKLFSNVTREFATGYYHWFFLIQGDGLPEAMIGNDPDYYLRKKLGHWSADGAQFDPDAVAEYVRCFSNPETIHASCEDYRAGASIDLVHDEADMSDKIECPMLSLWGDKGLMGRQYDVMETWRERALNVQGEALPGGHFLPEEVPAETATALRKFFLAD